jgi:hypothetical protein
MRAFSFFLFSLSLSLSLSLFCSGFSEKIMKGEKRKRRRRRRNEKKKQREKRKKMPVYYPHILSTRINIIFQWFHLSSLCDHLLGI